MLLENSRHCGKMSNYCEAKIFIVLWLAEQYMGEKSFSLPITWKVCNHEHWCWNGDQKRSRRQSIEEKFMENGIIFNFMLRDKIWEAPCITKKVRKLPTLDSWRSAQFSRERKNYDPIKFWVPVNNFRLREYTAKCPWSHRFAVLQSHMSMSWTKTLQRQCGD